MQMCLRLAGIGLIILLLLQGCGLRKKKEKETFQTPLEQYKDEDFYAQQRRSLDTAALNLQLIYYKAQYDDNFTPTISFTVQNKGKKSVSSFEVTANLGSTKSFFSQCIYRQSFKQVINPGESATFSYTIVQDDFKESCNDYPLLDLIREVCTDGTMNKKSEF